MPVRGRRSCATVVGLARAMEGVACEERRKGRASYDEAACAPPRQGKQKSAPLRPGEQESHGHRSPHPRFAWPQFDPVPRLTECQHSFYRFRAREKETHPGPGGPGPTEQPAAQSLDPPTCVPALAPPRRGGERPRGPRRCPRGQRGREEWCAGDGPERALRERACPRILRPYAALCHRRRRYAGTRKTPSKPRALSLPSLRSSGGTRAMTMHPKGFKCLSPGRMPVSASNGDLPSLALDGSRFRR